MGTWPDNKVEGWGHGQLTRGRGGDMARHQGGGVGTWPVNKVEGWGHGQTPRGRGGDMAS